MRNWRFADYHATGPPERVRYVVGGVLKKKTMEEILFGSSGVMTAFGGWIEREKESPFHISRARSTVKTTYPV